MGHARNMLERLGHEVAVGADARVAASIIRDANEEQSLERARILDADEVAQRAQQKATSRSERAKTAALSTE